MFRTPPFRTMGGFSMVELLVAIVILSIGLLGMAALQAATLRNNQSANYRTQASNLAYELVDTARSYQSRNTANVQAVLAPFAGWTATCAANAAATDCTSSNALTCDRQRWANRVCRSMPNARGRVVNYVPAAGTFTVEICWSDDRTGNTTPSANCSAASEGLGGQPYRLEARL
ncbi:type IV pilus modification protein PilV [Xanthomonadaceae bacterium XH05]|nr:type IV pilus modification protein PilV [Xanthomonadaceae bacterium XH05]